MAWSLSGVLRRTSRLSLELWQQALQEHSAPREIGFSVAVGVFAGCTPLVGFHLGVALILATLLRASRLWAAVGSRVSFAPLFAIISFGSIQTAHRLRTGAWVPLRPQTVVSQGKELMLDWLLGSAVVGVPLAAALGGVAYVAARRWDRISASRRAAPPRLSSESPPSGPLAPPR
ncbi:MAG: DUF2062 domain-containing protein [Myxococcota bacterium]|nr:DUF2062 domain-containing protein [Myxococcota bacterium]